jgi:hypothetical protein
MHYFSQRDGSKIATYNGERLLYVGVTGFGSQIYGCYRVGTPALSAMPFACL